MFVKIHACLVEVGDFVFLEDRFFQIEDVERHEWGVDIHLHNHRITLFQPHDYVLIWKEG